jgi:membrane-associated protease RseP (regulator of RpoE activity)
MRKIVVGWTLAAFSFVGCASTGFTGEEGNNYAKFYKAESGATPDAIAAIRAAPATGSPRVVPVTMWDASTASAYARQGYVLIGASGFTSGWPESDQDAISLGVQLGADLVVILAPEYKGTVTASVPLTIPNTTTSHTNGSATAYGPNGPVTAFGDSTTTTNGSSTTYMPMTVQRSAYAAGYFVKGRYHFGANFRDLTDIERQQFQTNRGAYVTYIVDNSPAYDSDILPGDVIVGVNGQAPSGRAGLMDLINANRGRTVDITVVRAGKALSKRVSILE